MSVQLLSTFPKQVQEAYNAELARLSALLRADAIDQETYSRAVAAAAETMREASDEFDGFAKGFEDIGIAMTSAFEDAIIEGKNLSDVLRGLEEDLLRIAIRRGITEPAAKGLDKLGDIVGTAVGGWLGGGGTDYVGQMQRGQIPVYFHRGGSVGSDGEPGPPLPASLWANAPRLHAGIGADEYPAILQRGETVIPRGAAPAVLQVVVNNNAGARVTARQTAPHRYDIDVDEAVADAVAFGRRTGRALDSRGALSRF